MPRIIAVIPVNGQDVLIDQNEGSQDYGNYYQKHMTKSNHKGMHDDAKQE